MSSCKYSREQLVSALAAEYAFLCHDDFDPATDMSEQDYLAYLSSLTIEQLIIETTTDDAFSLDEFMDAYL